MKTMKKIGSLALLLGCAGTAWAAGWPESPKPATPGGSVTLAEPYRILLTRSIFSRDGRAATVEYRHPTQWPSHPPAATTQSTQPSAFVIPTPDPEAGYVLRGVGMEDGVFTAFFEQTTENKGYLMHVGDTVARGKIMAISLDGIDYDLKSKVSRVIIGQALDGHMAAVAASATGGGSERTSRWIHHETPGATPPGPVAAPGGQPWRGGDQSRNADPRGGESRTTDSRFGGKQRSRDQERSRYGEQDKSRTEGPQGSETPERPDAKPTEPAPQGPSPAAGPGPGPEADDLPVIIIDPN